MMSDDKLTLTVKEIARKSRIAGIQECQVLALRASNRFIKEGNLDSGRVCRYLSDKFGELRSEK